MEQSGNIIEKGWFAKGREAFNKLRKLDEIISAEKFIVTDVISESRITTQGVSMTEYTELGSMVNKNHNPKDMYSKPTTDTEENTNRMNGSAYLWEHLTIIKVKPESEDNIINTLEFRGYTPILIGDIIKARLLKGEENYRYRKGKYTFNNLTNRNKNYFQRDYKEIECALEIIMENKDGKILRKDRSADYNKIFKDSNFNEEF